MHKKVKFMDEKDVYQTEINQLHNAICDFSHQSVSIKKVSITIYVAFLSIVFAFNNGAPTMPKGVIFLIGLIIPVFCYIYEIYIDYTRQILRARMDNLYIKLELSVGMQPRKSKSVRATIFGIDIDRKSKFRFYFARHCKAKKESFYYVDLAHFMYFIYLLEIVTAIVVGLVIKGS